MSEADDVSTVDRFNHIEQLINARFDTLERSNANINAQLSTRKTAINEITYENRQLHKRVKTLEERLVKLEKLYNNTDQNHRKNNVEVDGIPSYVQDRELRAVVATLFNHVTESDITIDDIEVAHRLYSSTSPKPTIVRLSRNLIEEIRSKDAKTKLRSVAERMGFPRGTRIFINDNQSPNMRALAYNARLLKNHNVIAETWFSNAAVRIKQTPSSKTLKITHEKDLFDHFPDFQHFKFDMDFYRQIKENEDVERYDALYGFDTEDDDDDFDFDPFNRSNTVPSVDAALHRFRNATDPSSSAKIADIMKTITAFTSPDDSSPEHETTVSQPLAPQEARHPPQAGIEVEEPTDPIATTSNSSSNSSNETCPSPGIEVGATMDSPTTPVNISTTASETSPTPPPHMVGITMSQNSVMDPLTSNKGVYSPQSGLNLKINKNPHITRSTTKSLSSTLFTEKPK